MSGSEKYRGGRRFAVRKAIVLFPFHSTVLKPDLDLTFGEAEGVRDLDASPTRQIAIEVELFLELEDLITRVGRSGSLTAVE